VRYSRGSGQLDVLFVIGTPRLSDVHSAFSPETLKNVTLVNIDNKQENQGFGDAVLVSPRASSVSEQVAQLLNDLKAPFDLDIAQNLLDGISYGTESFQSPRTSSIAFEMAGILMRQGAVRSRGQQQIPTMQQPQRQPQPVQQQAPVQPQPQQNFQSRPPMPQQQQNRDNRDRRPQFDQRQQDRGDNRDRRPQFDQRRSQPAQQNNPQPNQQMQPQRQPQPMQQSQQTPAVPYAQPQQDQVQDFDSVNPPTDWLTPKVYKGSSNV
jgi:hypothetical protein